MKSLAYLCAGLLTLLTGCKTSEPKSSTPRVAAALPALPDSVQIPDGWTPDTLAEIALSRHPGLRASQLRARGLSERSAQLGSLPDPMIGITGGELAETAAGQALWMARAEQAFPGPGKLDARADAADALAAAASLDAEIVTLDLARDVRRAAWRYVVARRTTAIHRETRTALEQVRDSVDARAAAGRASQQDQLRVASELGRIDQALIRSEQQRSSAQAQLNGLLVREAGAPIPKPSAPSTAPLPERENALARLSSHPEILALATRRIAAEQSLRQAKLSRSPDYVLGVQYTQVDDDGLAPSANGDDQMAATLGLRIPLWPGPRAAAIREAEFALLEVDARIDATRTRLQAAADSAWHQVDAATRQLDLLETQLIPEAGQAFDLTQTAYASGKQEYVDVIDSWRQVLALRLQHAQLLSERGHALAKLKRAINDSPPEP